MRLLTVLLSFFLFHCSDYSEPKGSDPYPVFVWSTADDCELYSYEAVAEGYLFKMGLSGSCSSISEVDYINAVKEYFSKKDNDFFNRSGKMIFELTETISIEPTLDELILLIDKKFDGKIAISSKDKSKIIINVHY